MHERNEIESFLFFLVSLRFNYHIMELNDKIIISIILIFIASAIYILRIRKTIKNGQSKKGNLMKIAKNMQP